jgi:hypothetical protein
MTNENKDRAAHPETRDAHPETRDAHPETRDAHPVTHDAHPETRDAHPETHDAHPVTGDVQKEKSGTQKKPKPPVVEPPIRLLPPVNRNARPYSGQRIGVKHGSNIDPIPANLVNLVLVDLEFSNGVLSPGPKTRVLDVAPWSGLPIVELS